MDLQHLSDEDFTTLRSEVAAEVARRESLARIPEQIMQLANQFTAIGGDPSKLTLPTNPAPTPEPEPEPGPDEETPTSE